jgi:hypothetical protein
VNGNRRRAAKGYADQKWTEHEDDVYLEKRGTGSAVKICNSLRCPFFRSTQILRFLVRAAVRMPRSTIAVVLLALAAVASTMTYTGFLVVGVLADQLGTGRVMAGLLLGVLFARIPWLSKGKLCTVGLLPKHVRRPIMMSLLALCLLSFLSRGEYVPALFTGFATAFLLTYPWMRRAIFGRILSSLFKPPSDQIRPKTTDDRVIDAEFRERKD